MEMSAPNIFSVIFGGLRINAIALIKAIAENTLADTEGLPVPVSNKKVLQDMTK